MKQQATALLALVVFFQLALGQFTGGVNGPCSATTIPGPFTTPINVFGNTGTPGVSTTSNSLCTTSNSPAIWYLIEPENSNQITVSTCAADTNFDTIISVYTGSCSFLTCFAYNDDDTQCVHPRTSSVTFSPGSFGTFYISVGGYGAGTGIFQLTVSEAGSSVAGSSCNLAIPVDVPVELYETNTIGTGFSSSCTQSSSKYVWYQLSNVLTGVPLNITTCSYYTNFDTFIGVFTACGNTTCVASNDDSSCFYTDYASSVSYTPTSSNPLYIAVGGFSTNDGDYMLSVQQEGITYVEECIEADIAVYGSLNYGYTYGSLPLTSTICYPITGMPSSWFYFVAPSTTTVVASTCNYYTNFNTALYVYSGSCNSLSCVSSSPVNYCINDASAKANNFIETLSPTPSASFSPTPSVSRSHLTSPTRTPTPTSTPSNFINNFGNALTFSATSGRTYYVVVTGETAFDSGSFFLWVGTY